MTNCPLCGTAGFYAALVGGECVSVGCGNFTARQRTAWTISLFETNLRPKFEMEVAPEHATLGPDQGEMVRFRISEARAPFIIPPTPDKGGQNNHNKEVAPPLAPIRVRSLDFGFPLQSGSWYFDGSSGNPWSAPTYFTGPAPERPVSEAARARLALLQATRAAPPPIRPAALKKLIRELSPDQRQSGRTYRGVQQAAEVALAGKSAVYVVSNPGMQQYVISMLRDMFPEGEVKAGYCDTGPTWMPPKRGLLRVMTSDQKNARSGIIANVFYDHAVGY